MIRYFLFILLITSCTNQPSNINHSVAIDENCKELNWNEYLTVHEGDLVKIDYIQTIKYYRVTRISSDRVEMLDLKNGHVLILRDENKIGLTASSISVKENPSAKLLYTVFYSI